jgi:hypothetical protein
MKERVLVLFLALCGSAAVAQPFVVSSTQVYADPKTGISVVGGAVALPESGWWQLDVGGDRGGLCEIFIKPPDELPARLGGDRLGRLHDRRAVEQARQQLSAIFWACRQYANRHENRGPDRFAELDPQQLHWIREQNALDHFALMPGVPLGDPDQFQEEALERVILAFEVSPQIDDGQHWVLWNDGQTERVTIDAQQLASHGLKVVPSGPPRPARSAGSDGTADYRILARRSGARQSPVTLTLRDRLSDRRVEVEWITQTAQPVGPELMRDWARLRLARWRVLDDPDSASILGLWLNQAPALYGVEPADADRRQPRAPGNQTTVFNVLGGRAAIEETLQMQAITGPDATDTAAPATARIDRIPGVQVKAHDYEGLLGGMNGGGIALANLVPPDRLFAWFPRPAALGQFLDGGTDFLHGLSSGFTGNSLDYGLSERYLARLGMNQDLLRALLESGAMTELAIILPDLYFIDGTDLTVITRLGEPVLAAVALKLLGLGDLTEITERTLPGGGTVYWGKRDDLLMLSSHRVELDRVLELAARDGIGSLGRSAEFRYMLTQLPPRDSTRAYLYFSDPFIRRLTGPGLKIGQLRRLTARAQLEAISAGALLYQVDHNGDQPAVETLFNRGYVPKIGGLGPSQFDLDEQLVVRSETFGPAGRMRTLLDRPIELATPAEARAYQVYRENYERFWRQFFDPIAIRLDQTEPDRMELETFILPLIDSSIYGGLRRGIAAAESRVPLQVPVLDPMPVAMLSANLTDDTWVEWLHESDELFVRVLGRDSSLLDLLGPGIHLALADGDPVLSTGSGDLAGIFGGAGTRFGNELLFIPVAVSLLTRPTSVLVELKDPAAAVRELSRLANGATRVDPGFLGLSTDLYRVAGRNDWIYTLSVGGVMKLRFGLNVQGRYLVISNQPLTHRPRLLAEIAAPNNGMRLELQPAAVKKLGPSLRVAAMEQQREAALHGAALLYPLLLGSGASTDEAARRHHALFGFTPLHPAGGSFVWHEEMVSSTLFGRPGAEQQPVFDLEECETGLMRHVKELSVSLQFEQDGLRVVCNWRAR